MTENLNWLAGEWLKSLESAIEATTGLKAEARLFQAAPPAENPLWDLAVTGRDGAHILVAASPQTANYLGRSFLSAAGLEDASETDLRGAFLELLRQSLSPLAQAIGKRAGCEIQFSPLREATELPANAECAGVTLASGPEQLHFEFACTPELLDLIAAAGQAPAPPSNSIQAAPHPGQGSRTFDLLLEVEMPVGVSFGRAQMRLKDAIKLTTGSIVELNRSISEPVELVVNNCVIARGEVVVVEGNYGVRIREIISREERLRTLF
jgi:flagellar motor switch protein FliN/FliY